MSIKAYKGFDRNMQCRGFQYKEGGEYEARRANVCKEGFHACLHPLESFSYYNPGKSVYHEVYLGGKIDDHGTDDTKVSATKIKIGARLTIAGLVKAAIVYTMAWIKPDAKADEERGASCATGDHGASSATGVCGASSATGVCGASSATGDRGASSAIGDHGASSATGRYGVSSATGYSGASFATGVCGASSATGYHGASSATGYGGASSATGYGGASSATGAGGASSATGYHGASSATGYGGASSATGYGGASSATGYYGASSADNPTAIAIAWGIRSKARGVKGAHIVLADWRQDKNLNWLLHGAKMVRIDGKKYRPGVWYTLKGGKVVEAKEE